MTMNKAVEVTQRIIALFLTNALGVITGAAIIAPELEIWKSACIAGGVAVFKVGEALARASLDGNLTKAEIDAAFGGTAVKAKKARRR